MNTKKGVSKTYVIYIITAVLILAILILVIKGVFFKKQDSLSIGKIELEKCKANLGKNCNAILKLNSEECNNLEPSILINRSTSQACKRMVNLYNYMTHELESDKCTNFPFDDSYYQINMDRAMLEGVCKETLNAISQNDESLCISEKCNDMYNFISAYKTKNIGICGKILDSSTKSDCEIIVSSDSSYCNYPLCDLGYNKYVEDINKNSLK